MSIEAKKLLTLLHYLANKNKLFTNKNKGLHKALNTKKKYNKKSKVLDLQ
jgi:hypothetical protein